MYQKILMAYDGSLEGRQALREGLLLGVSCGAELHLLAVSPTMIAADPMGMPTLAVSSFQKIFDDGVAKAQALGVPLIAKMAQGSPARAIGAYAREIDADLVVVGHHKPTLLERWWAGADQANLTDHVKCSILVARNVVSDAAFETQLRSRISPAV